MKTTIAPFVGVVLLLITLLCFCFGLGLAVVTPFLMIFFSGGFKVGLMAVILLLLGIFSHQIATNAEVK